VVVSLVQRIGYKRSRVRIPVDRRDICLLQKVQTGSGAYPAPNHWMLGSSQEVKRPGREINQSPTYVYCDKVRNGW
jgi:hypothetical protein